LGDLGNIVANEKGRAEFRIINKFMKLQEVIGRCLAVTAQSDDLGRGSNSSQLDGNSGEKYYLFFFLFTNNICHYY